MRSLESEDLRWALRRAPRAVLQLLKARAGVTFVGGGFLRACVANESVNDVDIFVSSVEAAREAAVFLQSKCEGAKLLETQNAFTVYGGNLPLSVQVIHRWVYTNPEQLMQSFDFTIAMAGFWWDAVALRWHSICDDRFYSDLAARRLRYTSPKRNEDAGGSLLRVLKFYQRGYRIPLDSMGAVMARLAINVDIFKILECQDANRELQLAKVLTGLLREVDPNIDPTHIAHFPSDDEQEEKEVEPNAID